MSSITTHVTGVKELMAKLEKLSDAAKGKALETSVKAGAYVVEAEAKINIEKKDIVDTGNLLNSIQVKDVKSSGDIAEASIGTNVVYAARQEFGFVGTDSLGRVYNQPARPYLRPAIDENHDKINDAVKENLKIEINKAIK
jgi:HK97 gp10 family phage protein